MSVKFQVSCSQWGDDDQNPTRITCIQSLSQSGKVTGQKLIISRGLDELKVDLLDLIPSQKLNFEPFVANGGPFWVIGRGVSGGTRNFLWGIEGENTFLKGQKSKNLPKMADFAHFFLLTGGKWRGQMPPMPPLMPPLGALHQWWRLGGKTRWRLDHK